eukprot:CAMPEP_0167748496 /NCGR_PEP_ID=MMETSP0110_2-20121227/4870_1 /TAXON_ID=629695 /ORGANISM="Gymnochlora sp., Strain CCMP2014" /LENGTH=1828 /DNA_ID=CAMNT_0007633517 /DNA_START=234 /DNA_END=5720 /DNA_ORIENTATION=-
MFPALQEKTINDVLKYRGCLAYVTNGNAAERYRIWRLMNTVRDKLDTDSWHLIAEMDSEEDLLSNYTSGRCLESRHSVYAGIIFSIDKEKDHPSGAHVLRAEIRVNGSHLPVNPNRDLQIDDETWRVPTTPYYDSGFLAIVQAIGDGLALLQDASNPKFKIRYQIAPLRPYFLDPLHATLTSSGSFYFVLGFFSIGAKFLQALVMEKEKKIKEGMKMMGLGSVAYYVSWYLTYSILSVIPCAIIAICSGLPSVGFFMFTPSMWLFLLLFLYLQSLIAFSFLAATFFDRSRTAGQLGQLLILILFLPTYLLNNHSPTWLYHVAAFSSPIAFSKGFNALADAEAQHIGIGWDNMVGGSNTKFGFGLSLLHLLGDCFLYLLVALWMENVWQGEYGVAKHPLFCFWMCCDCKKRGGAGQGYAPIDNSNESQQNHQDIELQVPVEGFQKIEDSHSAKVSGGDEKVQENDEKIDEKSLFETPAPRSSRDKYIHLQDVHKHFNVTPKWQRLLPCTSTCSGSPPVKAVRGLSLKIYPGEILALLGHNGAGKSTTIGVLTGLFPPTSGDIMYGRQDMIANMDSIRSCMGVCPQHDILFESLTVAEHLEFYGLLKGVSRSVLSQEIKDKMAQLELTDKRNAIVKTLSGGQKRRLSIAIALIGNARIVFLDEPTAGVDPLSRHQVWSILQRYKRNTILILTTHHMDEADLLGDRVAIMAHGKLRCYGTSLFLKNRLGNGYHLDMVKVNLTVASEPIIELVQRLVPGARTHADVGLQIALTLPYARVDCFSKLFKVLEESIQQEQSLGISTFGISLTTLEEVFLKIADSEDDGDSQCESSDDLDSNDPLKTRKINSNSKESESKFQSLGSASVTRDTFADSLGDEKQVLTDSIQSPIAWLSQSDEKNSNRALFLGGEPVSNTPSSCGDGAFYGLVVKRVHVATREKRSIALQFLFPLVYVILLLVALKTIDMSLYSHHVEPSSSRLSLSPPRSPFEGSRLPLFSSNLGALMDATNSLKKLQNWEIYAPDPYVPVRPKQSAERTVRQIMNSWLVSSTANPNATYTAGLINYFDKMQFSALLVRNSSTPNAFPMLLTTMINAYLAFHASNVSSMSASTATVNSIVSNSSSKRRWWGGGTDNKGDNVILQDDDSADNFTGHPYFLDVFSHPLPYDTTSGGQQQAVIRALLIAITMGICYASIPLTSIVNIVKEKEKKIQLQLRVSGVSSFSYWGSNLIIDAGLFCFPVAITYILFSVFDEPTLTGNHPPSPTLVASLAIFTLYALEATICTYALSFLFSKTITAQTVVSMIFTWGGVLLLIVSITMTAGLSQDGELRMNTSSWSTTSVILTAHPAFGFMWGFYQVAMFTEAQKLSDSTDDNLKLKSIEPWDVFDWDRTGPVLLGMFLWFLAYGLIIYAVEMNYFRSFCKGSSAAVPRNEQATERRTPGLGPRVLGATANNSMGTETKDVRAERKRVDGYIQRRLQSRQSEDERNTFPPLLMRNLTKDYTATSGPRTRPQADGNAVDGNREQPIERRVAVSNLSVGIQRGECFGLLGPNGAGKTTTIKMLIGEEQPTSGEAWINGERLHSQGGASQNLGICLQQDALIDQMTGLEHLHMYARIRGLSTEIRRKVVDVAISLVGLGEHKDKLASEYSGGNKRKLSCAIALMGWPKTMLLDEPSTGIDPVARRALWDVIRAATNHRSVMLTTHSMEEADALCTRMGILVNGKLQCIGNSQHLKSSYGTGYHLEIQTSGNETSIQRVKHFVTDQICDNASKTNAFGGKLRFVLPKIGVSLSEVFAAIEVNKKALLIKDYSLSQTTLEQVFIGFAREQIEEGAPSTGT